MRVPELAWHAEKLPYFAAIIEAGSIRKAARALRLSQPSLSKAMQLLEVASGMLLMERRKSGVTLTPAGERLYQLTKSSFHALSVFSESAAFPKQRRTLRLVTHELIVPALARGLLDLERQVPSVAFQLNTDLSIRRLAQMVEGGEADIGVSAVVPRSGSLAAELIGKDAYAFFGAPGLLNRLEKRGRRITREAMATLPVILAPNVLAAQGETLGEHLCRIGLEINSRYQVDSLESVAALVRAELGIGLLPIKLTRHLRGAGTRQLLLESPLPSQFGELSLVAFCRHSEAKTDVELRQVKERIVGALSEFAE